ncbi:MAG: GNAT family N-acetyltransferase [Chloroflexota bacterium]
MTSRSTDSVDNLPIPQGSPIEVRLAREDEIGSVKAILDDERAIFGFLPRPAIVDAQRQQSLLVAVQGQRIVGFARLHHRRDQVTTLYEIAVVADLRRRGIGHALTRGIIEEAICRGQKSVQLKCPAALAANSFYSRLGFSPRGQEAGKRTQINLWGLTLAGAVLNELRSTGLMIVNKMPE